MKYNKKAYEIGESLMHICNIDENKNDKKLAKTKTALLTEILKKAQNALLDNKQNNGMLKICFKSCFYKESEKGYEEIKTLIENDVFDSFAREYCMYLGKIETRCDEYYTAYYEIIWDYKTYYEQQKSKHEQETIKKTLKKQ